MPTLPCLPDIAIVSYLGENKDLRQKRLELHLKQRAILNDLFDPRSVLIMSICSDYSKSERKALDSENYPTYHIKERTHKYQKHNLILSELYKSPTLKSMLLLDDTEIPRLPKEGDLENGLVNTASLVASWLQQPDLVPASCCYFACCGLKFDAFYKSNPVILGEAPQMVTGWATWVRSDLGVLQPEDLYRSRHTRADDMVFRIVCQAHNKPVLKHYRAFFRSLQGANTEKASTLYKGQDDRNQDIKETTAILKLRYPEVFAKKSTKKDKDQDTRPKLGLLGDKS